MLIKQLVEVFDLLDSSTACGADIADYLRGIDPKADVEVSPLVGPRGKTDMVKVRIPGTNGKAAGGTAPTIGILGRLGAIGARPEMIGYVKKCTSIAASPYGEWDALHEAARRCRELPGDLIVLDCIGFTQEMKNMFVRESGKRAVLPRTLLARVVSELTDVDTTIA